MPLQCCTPRMTKSSGIRERTQFCLRLPLNVKCCVLIRLLDTKQIWKAGRQKKIVSCTFFPPSCLPKSLFFAACQATG